jgi:chaperonin GroEL (HSP60 family)
MFIVATVASHKLSDTIIVLLHHVIIVYTQKKSADSVAFIEGIRVCCTKDLPFTAADN